jgi:hypothetical protein
LKESALVSQTIQYLTFKGHTVWRNNSGAVRIGTPNSKYNRQYLIKLAPVGSPDIIGWEKGTGRFIGIECKVGYNKPTQFQKDFAERMQKDGCLYILAYSLSDVEKVL